MDIVPTHNSSLTDLGLSEHDIGLIQTAKSKLSNSTSSDVVLEVKGMLSQISNCITQADIMAELIEHLWTTVDHEALRSLVPNSAALLVRDARGCNASHRACLRHFRSVEAKSRQEPDMRSAPAILFLEETSRQSMNAIHEKTGGTLRSRTCLHIAAERGLHRVIDWLLHQGADAEMTDDDGKQAWQIAIANGDDVAAGLFAAYRCAFKTKSDWFRQLDSARSRLSKYDGQLDEKTRLFTVSANRVSLS